MKAAVGRQFKQPPVIEERPVATMRESRLQLCLLYASTINKPTHSRTRT